MKISCDKDEVYIRLPRLADAPDYEGQKLYEVDKDLMDAYVSTVRAAEYLRKQLIAACGLTAALALSLAPSAHAQPLWPDPHLTPGMTITQDASVVCRPGYAKSVRNVTESEKRRVYAEYRIVPRHRGEFEIDHLVSLELGGSNDIKNLWPQSYETPVWNAHVKDKLEDKLHAMVCHGALTLPEAQRAIATDWRTAYCTYVRRGLPCP